MNKAFYIQYGKVCYAMSMADGEIQDQEKEILRTVVKENLAVLETSEDEYGSNLAYYTLFSFEQEEEQRENLRVAMASFLDWLHTHRIQLSEEVKNALVKVLKKIAQSYGRFTKTEQEVLTTFIDELNAYHAKALEG